MKLKVVVDTNILFSALLNPTGKIGTILLNSKKQIQFYSCDFLNTELLRHRSKLLRISGLSEIDLADIESILRKKIIFINEKLLPMEILEQAEASIKDIDIDDAPFVALTRYLGAKLGPGIGNSSQV